MLINKVRHLEVIQLYIKGKTDSREIQNQKIFLMISVIYEKLVHIGGTKRERLVEEKKTIIQNSKMMWALMTSI